MAPVLREALVIRTPKKQHWSCTAPLPAKSVDNSRDPPTAQDGSYHDDTGTTSDDEYQLRVRVKQGRNPSCARFELTKLQLETLWVLKRAYAYTWTETSMIFSDIFGSGGKAADARRRYQRSSRALMIHWHNRIRRKRRNNPFSRAYFSSSTDPRETFPRSQELILQALQRLDIEVKSNDDGVSETAAPHHSSVQSQDKQLSHQARCARPNVRSKARKSSDMESQTESDSSEAGGLELDTHFRSYLQTLSVCLPRDMQKRNDFVRMLKSSSMLPGGGK